MAAIAVNDTPQLVPVTNLGAGVLVLQNLDAANAVYFAQDPAVDAATGVRLAAGELYEFRRAGHGAVYVVCATGLTADLRWLSY